MGQQLANGVCFLSIEQLLNSHATAGIPPLPFHLERVQIPYTLGRDSCEAVYDTEGIVKSKYLLCNVTTALWTRHCKSQLVLVD